MAFVLCCCLCAFTVGHCSSEEVLSVWLCVLQVKVIEEKLNSQLIDQIV